jgi:hypothetical protein
MPVYEDFELVTYDDDIDDAAFAQVRRIAETTAPIAAPVPHKAPPVQVDLSKYLHYIRKQAGGGCWGYSLLAVWDIMNEMACPYSPNLSMNLSLLLHRTRKSWQPQGGLFSVDGRFHKGDEFHLTFGNSTEGTELTHHLWTGGWTLEGTNEAHNYRLACKPLPIAVNSSEFIKWLAAGHPIRAGIPGHFVAIVGYDAANKTFKYVNSVGDRWGANGFATYTFDQIDNKNKVHSADIIKIVPPKPVPAARISFTHSNRMNVNLWLSVEDSPIPKRKIWPHLQPRREKHYSEWDDNSRNLSYTVRLPSELIWPPSTGSRLVLDLYDSGAFSDTGGTLTEFTSAFGGHVLNCSELSKGPTKFNVREHRRFHIP